MPIGVSMVMFFHSPFVCEGVEEFACTEGGGFAFAFEVETKIAAEREGL